MTGRTNTEASPDTNYPVLVKRRGRNYDLRIWELRLAARGPDLQKAYDELMRRKQEVIDWARTCGSLAELPRPKTRPVLDGENPSLGGPLRWWS